MVKIITRKINPPIPTNKFDWEALREGYEEGCLIGYGASEEDAINDLLAIEETRND